MVCVSLKQGTMMDTVERAVSASWRWPSLADSTTIFNFVPPASLAAIGLVQPLLKAPRADDPLPTGQLDRHDARKIGECRATFLIDPPKFDAARDDLRHLTPAVSYLDPLAAIRRPSGIMIEEQTVV